MLVLSTLFYLVGFGLSRFGVAVTLPFAVPLGIPVLSLLVALYVQSPREAAEMDAFVDERCARSRAFPPFLQSMKEALLPRQWPRS